MGGAFKAYSKLGRVRWTSELIADYVSKNRRLVDLSRLNGADYEAGFCDRLPRPYLCTSAVDAGLQNYVTRRDDRQITIVNHGCCCKVAHTILQQQ